ncbi:MAG: OmpA family protein [Puniceicoccales bacterium]|nr:OmpA family protein [Puniceicoccales bacterium]
MVSYTRMSALCAVLLLSGCGSTQTGPSPELTVCGYGCEDTAHYRSSKDCHDYGRKDLVGQVFFGVDDVKLGDDDKYTLRAVIAELNSYPERGVLLVGYCDGKGKETYNMSLSQKRIEAVAEFLQSEGIAAGRLKGDARGAVESVARGQTKFDRRVDIMFR